MDFCRVCLFLIIGVVGVSQYSTASSYVGTGRVGYKYFSLDADQIPEAYTETTGVNVLSVEWAWPSIVNWFVPSLIYEFSPGTSARQQALLKRKDTGSDNAWEKYGLDLEFDVSDWIGVDLTLSANKQTFLYSVQASRDYYFVSDENTELLLPGDELSTVNEYEEYALSAFRKYTVSPDLQLGWKSGLYKLEYRKPFSTSFFNGNETIYDAEFSATGIQFGGSLTWKRIETFVNLRTLLSDSEIKLPGGFRVSGISGSGSYTGKGDGGLDYQEYLIGAKYVHKDFYNKMDFEIKADYSVRSFSGYVANINDDTFVNLTANLMFSL